MKKIYITSLHMMHGGVEMAITLLANALVKKKYDVEILCIYNLGKPVYKLDERVKLTYLTDVHPNREEFRNAVSNREILAVIRESVYALNVLYLKRKVLIEKFKEVEAGIIISTRNEHSILLSKYGNATVKKIAQLHHDHKFKKSLLNDFRKKYSEIDVFVLLTELLKDEVQEVMKENNHTQCVVIPNFLDVIPKEQCVERKNQVVAVGRLHEVKGFQRLINIWKDFEIDNKPILKIIGNGEERKKLEVLIAENHLENEVFLTGAMEHNDVMREMQESLFFVMTSFSEAFPFVLIEAMSNGLPVVAFDVRVGPTAIIEDAKSGFLVPDDNKDRFIECVKILIEDEGVRNKMSKAAFDRSRVFTEETVIEKWIEILEV